MDMTLRPHSGDNSHVILGVFDFVSTYGLPLDMVVQYLKERGLVVDWANYILDATGTGQNERTTKIKIENAIEEVFGQKGLEECHHPLNVLLPLQPC